MAFETLKALTADLEALTRLEASESAQRQEIAALKARIAELEAAPKPVPAPEPEAPSISFPNATNTGTKGALSVVSGSKTITTAGTVVKGLDLRGSLVIDADNVTVENCKVWSVYVKPGRKGAVVRDNEIAGRGAEGSHGILGTGTFQRNNIYGVENGITLNGDDAVIEQNYIHDLKASGSPHYDGIQIDGGVKNVVIRRNTIINDHSQTAAVMIDNYFGPISNIKVDGNHLKGGGYTIYSDGQFSGGPISGVEITNNYVERGYYGLYAINKNTPVMSGNIEGAPPAQVN